MVRVVNEIGLLSGLIAARIGEVQLAVAARILRMDADTDGAAIKLVDAARANMDRLANVAIGVGGNLDVSV